MAPAIEPFALWAAIPMFIAAHYWSGHQTIDPCHNPIRHPVLPPRPRGAGREQERWATSCGLHPHLASAKAQPRERVDGKQPAVVLRIKALWRLLCCVLPFSAGEEQELRVIRGGKRGLGAELIPTMPAE
jgi:hypothetical protein